MSRRTFCGCAIRSWILATAIHQIIGFVIGFVVLCLQLAHPAASGDTQSSIPSLSSDPVVFPLELVVGIGMTYFLTFFLAVLLIIIVDNPSLILTWIICNTVLTFATVGFTFVVWFGWRWDGDDPTLSLLITVFQWLFYVFLTNSHRRELLEASSADKPKFA